MSFLENVQNNFLYIILGLSDEMRNNFTVMKDLAQHTRIGPAQKSDILKNFMKDLNTNPESKKELADWNMSFSPDLLGVTGRKLPTQRKYFVSFTLSG